MIIYALDTNILSYLLKDDEKVCSALMRELTAGNTCIIPPVAYYEIRRGLLYANAIAKLGYFDELCQDFPVGVMNRLVWDETAALYAKLRRSGQMREDADLFIAAFCLVGGYTLVTNNVRHFAAIDNLAYANWTL